MTTSPLPDVEIPATAQVRQIITGWIASGHLNPGMRLPTEMALCQQTGFSRTTIRAALQSLKKNGDIEPALEGRGWCVAPLDAAFKPKTTPKEQHLVGVVSGFETGVQLADHRSKGWRTFTLLSVLQHLALNGKTSAIRTPECFTENHGDFSLPYQAWIATHDAAADDSVRELLGRWHQQRVPVVIQYDTEESLPFDQVLSDHVVGARMATEWLLQRGCRRILHFLPVAAPLHDDGPLRTWRAMRNKGFLQAHEAAGLVPVEPPTAYHNARAGISTKEVHALSVYMMLGWLHQAFQRHADWDAIFCMTDGVVAAMKEALRLLKGPEAVRAIPVAGYDNYWMDSPETRWSGHRPDITVDKRNTEIGHALYEVLRQRLDDPDNPERIIRRVVPELKTTV